MKIVMLKARLYLACLFLILSFSCTSDKKEKYSTLNYQKAINDDYSTKLNETISYLKQLDTVNDLSQKKELYIKARLKFKSLEPYLAFFDKNNYKSLNAPNILKVEEEDATNIKINNPFGFQVIEELLYDDEQNVDQLHKVINKTKARLTLIAKSNKILLKDYHLLWLLRNQIAQTALTGITGFDSPVLEQSIQETKEVYKTIEFILTVFKSKFTSKDLYNNWLNEIAKTQKSLTGAFNTFNRYGFIKDHSQKQLELLVQTAKDWKVTYPFTMAFNNNGTSLFSNETFNLDYFSDPVFKNTSLDQKASLGKKLFNDKRLSKNGAMSCATCHQKDKAFTDGLRVFPKQKRNTPTLTYATFQKSFFYDGRSGSLEGQIINVVKNTDEFHSNLQELENFVKTDSTYVKQFNSLYGKVSDAVIRNAIASYIRTLSPFNSKFDNNINGKETSLSQSEIDGFNLFMGKGKCATCHFPPVFNGTVPPNFNDTELEAIGVPNVAKTALSEDLGRYYLFHTKERKHFFKTPTVRNIALTAPYMHNGTFKTLEEVMDFYNNGGGVGMGFTLDYQTLPSDSLHLSKKEVSSMIAFLKTLSDGNY